MNIQVVTVTVGGRHELRVSFSPNSQAEALVLTNVRFVVENGSRLNVRLADSTDQNEEPADDGRGYGGVRGSTTLKLQGIAQQDSNGGVLEVEEGGSAVFLVPVLFDSNSVAKGYSGGALHVDGEVTFEHAAHFIGNRAFGLEPSGGEGSCGGAVSIGQGGRVVFEEFASFEENWSGRGGALCNRGSAEFFRRSFFNGNTASGKLSGVSSGGDGGAIYTEKGSETAFTRKSTMLRNSAGRNGGAVYNAGTLRFSTSADFHGNRAEGLSGHSEASGLGGGHVFNRGVMSIKGDASFREGSSGGEGGALYTVSGDTTILGGITTLEGNTADGKCDDLFSALSGGEVKLTTTSRPRTPTQQRRRTSRLIRTTPCQG
eukprot:jgi/Undpi1/14262/HiC_scaffold_9.g03911.m1